MTQDGAPLVGQIVNLGGSALVMANRPAVRRRRRGRVRRGGPPEPGAGADIAVPLHTSGSTNRIVTRRTTALDLSRASRAEGKLIDPGVNIVPTQWPNWGRTPALGSPS